MSVDDLGEFVKRYLARQVMNVVDTDVASEPHQWLGQVIVGAAMQRGVLVSPCGFNVPVGFVKLMLNVKQPDTNGAAEDDQWQLY